VQGLLYSRFEEEMSENTRCEKRDLSRGMAPILLPLGDSCEGITEVLRCFANRRNAAPLAVAYTPDVFEQLSLRVPHPLTPGGGLVRDSGGFEAIGDPWGAIHGANPLGTSWAGDVEQKADGRYEAGKLPGEVWKKRDSSVLVSPVRKRPMMKQEKKQNACEGFIDSIGGMGVGGCHKISKSITTFHKKSHHITGNERE